LTPGACFAKSSSLLCAGTPGISGAQSIAISANGTLLAVGADPGIVVFKRNPADGTLTDVGCVDDGSSGTCVNGGGGYADIEGVAIAPDDRAVYGAARAGNSVLVIGYDPASNHALTALQCLSSPNSPPTGCTATSAVFAPNWVAVSPAGAGAPAVYTADFNAGEVSTFIRNPDDTLTWLSCRSFDGSAGGTPGICQQDYRLQLVSRVMVSPDGRNVYAIAPRSNPKQGSQDIAIYSRDPNSGLITPLPDPNSCWADSDTGPEGHCQQANGMADPAAMVLSPAGDQMYVAVNDDMGDIGGPNPPGGIAIFNRELPPACTTLAATTQSGKPVTLSLLCAGSNGNPVTISVLTPATDGTLSAVGPGDQVTFTPAKNFAGVVTFTFSASDGSLSSAPATATVQVLAPAPVKLSIPKQTDTIKHGVAKIRLRCSGPLGRFCSGTLTLWRQHHGKLTKIGSARFTVKSGTTATVSLHVRSRTSGRVQAEARYLSGLTQTATARGNVKLA
jgi:6-phosphogluconolactonase (cycloisomerase 2 family)